MMLGYILPEGIAVSNDGTFLHRDEVYIDTHRIVLHDDLRSEIRGHPHGDFV